MNCSQKLTNARADIPAYIPELKDWVNMITFREIGVATGEDQLPPMYLMGPTLHYIKNKIDELTPQQVTYLVACNTIIIKEVMENEEKLKDLNPEFNVLALSVFAQSFLRGYPEHAFQPFNEWDVDWDVVEGKSTVELYKLIRKSPEKLGTVVKEKAEELKAEQKEEVPDVGSQKMLEKWLDE